MKKLLSTALLAFVAMVGQAQEIIINEPTFSDYLALFNAKGYMAYSFDVSQLKGCKIEMYLKAFSEGKETQSYSVLGSAYAFEPKGKKLIIGFLPAENDSTQKYCYSLEDTFTYTGSISLKPVYWASENKWMTQYHTRPFEMSSFEKEKFIPLVLCGSVWYDEKWKITRFCGENTIKPDLSSDILKFVPHYYIIGVIVH